MFKEGDIVTMSLQGTRWCKIQNGDFWSGGNNPFGIEGTVLKVSTNSILPVSVRWSNGHGNCYSEKDLITYNFTLENE